MHVRRYAVAALCAPTIIAFTAAPALAHECTNASKPAGAGVQVLIGPDDNIEWATKGVWNRIDQGLIDPDTGEGFSGLIGIDFDGDMKADFSTYIVGPNDELPDPAQWNGPVCKGITNLGPWFEECFPG
jgi:hypothetical protein